MEQPKHVHGQGQPEAGESLQVGILTCSDRGARGERADVSGPTLHNLVIDRLGGSVKQYKVVPDERMAIEATLTEWADEQKLDLILTTGGTGFAPRDVTPDATRAVVERETPAIVQAMLFESLRVTPYAMLTRATAGIRRRTLIVNLPGSPKALTENFDAVAEVLPHAVDIIRGTVVHGGGGAGGHSGGHSDGHGGHGGHRAADIGASQSSSAGSHSSHAGSHSGHASDSASQAAQPEPATRPASGGMAKNVGGPPC